MQLSARNQFTGTVAAIKEGAVNGVVTIDVDGVLIRAGITMDAIRDLGLTEGMVATAVVKATNVVFALGDRPLPISAPNQLVGTIEQIERGAVAAVVTLVTGGGLTVEGSIALDAVDELGLVPGVAAVAIMRSTDVMVGAPRD